MLLVYANPPLHLCLYSKAQPGSAMRLILRQRIHFYVNLDHKITFFSIVIKENVIHVSQFLLHTSILIISLVPFYSTVFSLISLFSSLSSFKHAKKTSFGVPVWHQMNALLKRVLICYQGFVFHWLRAWFGNNFQKQSGNVSMCGVVHDSRPLKRTLKAKWVYKQALTCKLSSDGHLTLPVLISGQVRWAYACVHKHTLIYTHTISAWQCHSSLETNPGRSFMHYPLHIARPQCNRNLSIKMDSFCSLCTSFNTVKEGRARAVRG